MIHKSISAHTSISAIKIVHSTYAVALSNITACCRASDKIIGAKFLKRKTLDAKAAIMSTTHDSVSEG